MDAEWFGYLGATLLAAMSIPQFVRIVRDRSAEGVSLTTWLLFALSAVSWLAYGISLAAPAILIGNAMFMATVLPVVALLLIRQRGWPPAAAVVVTCATAAAAVYLLTLVPARVPGWLGVAVGVATTIPQLLTSMNNRRAGLRSEVSALTYILLLCGQSLWLLYGLFTRDAPIVTVNVIAICVNLAVVVTELGRERARTS